MGLGPRVPFMMIGPYAKRHYVSHVQHEFGSILKFTEQVFLLPSMHNTDDRADALRDCIDFAQAPQPFRPIPTFRKMSFFEDQAAADTQPDDDY
jgi:phospholipase C